MITTLPVAMSALCLLLALPRRHRRQVARKRWKGPRRRPPDGGDLRRARKPEPRTGAHLRPDRRPRRRPAGTRHLVRRGGVGGVWKTNNAGTTWTPIFDDQGSYSIGCVAVDPRDPLTVWVGTGENNSQRSVVWRRRLRSTDGGKSWENVGLKNSEHIAKIVVDPRDSNVVFVAAQGRCGRRAATAASSRPRRRQDLDEGSRRRREHRRTDVELDPGNPDVLYAATYQRRRHVWTLIDGGPGFGDLQVRPTAARPGTR